MKSTRKARFWLAMSLAALSVYTIWCGSVLVLVAVSDIDVALGFGVMANGLLGVALACLKKEGYI